jgi:predicted site-specific integrase-resolvase
VKADVNLKKWAASRGVEHRERLVRFGGEYVEAALAAYGRRLMVSTTIVAVDDCVGDVTEVLTLLCARWWGRRAEERRARRVVAAIEDPAA